MKDAELFAEVKSEGLLSLRAQRGNLLHEIYKVFGEQL